MSRTHQKNHLEWLKDAHAMEKQAESILEKMAGRLAHYPDLKARISRHIEETSKRAVGIGKICHRPA